MRKTVGSIAVLATAAALLTGCSSAPTGAGGHQTIRFLSDSLTDEQKKVWLDTLITPFEKANPDITVNFQPNASSDQAVRVQIASGNAPDLFTTDVFTLEQYADAHDLLPLDKYVKQYGLDGTIYPWALNVTKVKGAQYAIPNEFEASVFIYNADLLKKNGWSVPTTRAEFEKVCQEAAAKGIMPIAYGDSGNLLFNQWLYDKYLATYAGAANVKALFEGKIKFTDAPIADSFALLKKDWQNGWITNKQSASTTEDQARSLWYNQKALFNVEGTWMQTNIATTKVNFDYGVTSFPSMQDGVPSAASVGVGSAIAVSAKTKYPAAVAKFLAFMYKQPKLAAAGIARGIAPRSTPLNTTLLPKMDKASTVFINALYKLTAKGTENLGYTPWTYYPPQTNTYLYTKMDAMLYGKTSLTSYLNGAQSAFDKELSSGFKFRG